MPVYIGKEISPIEWTLRIFDQKWNPYVLLAIAQGSPVRFNELLRRVQGIRQPMLTQSLSVLVEKRLIARIQLSLSPPHVEYALTTEGADFTKLFEYMYVFGKKYMNCPMPPCSLMPEDVRLITSILNEPYCPERHASVSVQMMENSLRAGSGHSKDPEASQ